MKNMLKSLIWGGVISLISMSSTTLQAQIPATLPDVWVSDDTTTNSYIPDPIIDDVVVNSDMITDVNSDLPIKAIAWYDGQDDGTGAGGNIWMKLSPNTSTMQFRPTVIGTINKTELKLYPNPANSYICLSQSESYTIYSLSGGVIQKGKAEKQQPINIQSLAKGNYIFQTASGKSIHFTKL